VDGFKLGMWVVTVRGSYSAGTLAADFVRRLEELPGWSWNTADSRWEKGFTALRDYIEQRGNAEVPQSYASADGYSLGKWVNGQRVRNAKGALSEERRRRLNSLRGWCWDPKGGSWDRALASLHKFVAQTGHARVPISFHDDSGFKLGSWVGNQRQRRKLLTDDQRQRLEKVPGWSWNPHDDDWNDGYQRLRQYVSQNKTALVPMPYNDPDGFRLGQWVSVQRGAYAKGVLGDERTEKLQALPGWSWNPRGDQWNEGYQRLLRFVTENGHARVPASHQDDDGFRLGQWVSGQRSAHAKGTLSAERRHKFEKLPGWSWTLR
jgi:hypothetical protein